MAIARNGDYFPDEAPMTITRNGDNTVNTMTVVWQGKTYVQTFGYTSGQLTSTSGWVLQ
jgi:hypothetical protein